LSKPGTITVLSLHRISEDRDHFYNPIKPDSFNSLLEYCCKHYEVTNFANINLKTKKPKLILSFDDGYNDFISTAVPILKKMGVPSNHNVVNACLNNNSIIWTQELNDLFNFLKENNITDDEIIAGHTTFKENWGFYYMSFFKIMLQMPQALRNNILKSLIKKYNLSFSYKMMNWEDVIDCVNNHDVEIGCHTYNHDSLGSVRDVSFLETELNIALAELKQKTGKPVSILALPNGTYNDIVIDYAKTKGIKNILLSDNKIINAITVNGTLNMLGRINMADESIYEMILRMECFHTKIRNK